MYLASDIFCYTAVEFHTSAIIGIEQHTMKYLCIVLTGRLYVLKNIYTYCLAEDTRVFDIKFSSLKELEHLLGHLNCLHAFMSR